MVRSDIFSQAQGGNPDAIATLMNHSLQRKQVTVRAALQAGCLTILATSREGPDATFMANFVRRGLDRLRPQQVDRVVIRGYALGGVSSLWTAEYDPRRNAPLEIISNPNETASTTRQPTTRPPLSGLSKTGGLSETGGSPKTEATSLRQRRSTTSRPATSRTATSRFAKAPRFAQQLLTGLAAIVFVALSVATVVLAFQVKQLTARFTEISLYQIQFLGDLLRGVEASEVFNVVVFAILGLGLGLATLLVPRDLGIRVNATVGLLALPAILSISSTIRYESWLDEFARAEELTTEQAIAQTDIYLQDKVDRTGALGFYLHTANDPGLPRT